MSEGEGSLIPRFDPYRKDSIWEKFLRATQSVWEPYWKKYHNVIDNPKRLHFYLHPFISKVPESASVYEAPAPTYMNFHLSVPHRSGVDRRMYFNLSKENFIVGALGAVMAGIGTRSLLISTRQLKAIAGQKTFHKVFMSGGQFAASYGLNLVSRIVIGGVLYDGLRRSQEIVARESHVPFHRSDFNRAKYAGIAGGLCGFLFGIRGGLPAAWMASAFLASGAMLNEFHPVPTRIKFGVPKTLREWLERDSGEEEED